MMRLLTTGALVFLSFVVVMQAGYKVGDVAEDFTLKNVDGSMMSLADLDEAKGFIVIFSCNHCPYVVKYEDRMIELHNQFADIGYPVVAINSNDPEKVPEDSFDNMVTRAEDKGFPFPYLFDATQQVAKDFGATRTPHVFLLQRSEDSKLKVAYIGAIDDSPKTAADVKDKYVAMAISAIENNGTPDPEFTKAIGCTIKWRE